MKEYIGSDEMMVDAKQFMESEYGRYRMAIIDEMIEGALASASDINEEHSDRYLARYAALKEIKQSFINDLGNDAPARKN